MSNYNSVGTVNRFSLFGNVEDDPGDAPFSPTNSSAQDEPSDLNKDKQVKQKPKEKQQVGKVSLKQQDNAPRKTEEKPRTSNNRSGKFEERSSFGGTTSSNRGKPPRKFQDRGRQNSEEPEDGEGRPSTTGPRRGTRRGGMGRGGSGMGRTGQGVGRGGKREFDRRSGSDKSSVKPIEKRGGEGSHNWGTVQDDLKATSSEQSEWPTDETMEKKGDSPKDVPEQKEEEGAEKDESKEVNGEAQQEEDAVKEMTLDEYKAMKEKTRAKTDYKERRPGENEDSAQWKNTVVLKKETSNLYAGTREIIEKPKTSGRKVEVLQSNFYFKDPTRNQRGGARGGRGRDRDGRGPDRDRVGDRDRSDRERGDRDRSNRGRGNDGYRGRSDRPDRGGRSKGERRELRLPDVGNESDFPALGN